MGVAVDLYPTGSCSPGVDDDVIKQGPGDPLAHVLGVDEEVDQFDNMVSSGGGGEPDELALAIGRCRPAAERRIVRPGEDQSLRMVQQGRTVASVGQ